MSTTSLSLCSSSQRAVVACSYIACCFCFAESFGSRNDVGLVIYPWLDSHLQKIPKQSSASNKQASYLCISHIYRYHHHQLPLNISPEHLDSFQLDEDVQSKREREKMNRCRCANCRRERRYQIEKMCRLPSAISSIIAV